MPNMPTGAKMKCRTTASVALSNESAANRRTSGHDKKPVVEIAKVKKVKNDECTKSKTIIRIPTNKESEFCETIAYDEHMDQGIPQTLLDGLGFHPEANGSNDDDDERISELGHNSSRDTEKAMLVARAQVPPLSSSSISKKSRQGRRSKTSQPYSTTNANTDQSACQSTLRLSPSDSEIYQSNLPIDLSKRTSQNPMPPSPVRPCTNLPRDHVQYAHHPQGFVVARIVRDEPKPSKRRSRARNSESAEVNPQVLEIAEGCPFNENNVEEVLGELMEHTDAMRRKMASMKDDMRRVCGTGASLRTKEQQNKGVEVSQRLQKAYLTYTMALENIERWDETQNDEEQAGDAS